MMQGNVILKNSIVGFLYQIVLLFIQFITRIIILRYIGIEMVGISSTLSSILATLSLTELGFQTAIVYFLYEPLHNDNKEKISQLMVILRKVYIIIGIIFLLFSIGLIPILNLLMKGVAINKQVIEIHILLSLNNAMTYFVAYKRALLYADQKEYITKIFDLIFNFLFGVLGIAIIVLFNNYVMFLVIQIFQVLTCNISLHIYTSKKYLLHKSKFDWKLFKQILKEVKNIFWEKVAGYVYGATDNLIISGFLGTIYVGYISNYNVLINAIKQFVNAIFNSMTPVIGKMLLDGDISEKAEEKFITYSYIRYFLASVIILPWIFFINYIVKVFFGSQYIMEQVIIYLMAADLYIHIVYSGNCEYINAAGLFKEDKIIAFMGAIINIIISLIGALKCGIEGVLLGTVISQVFFWITRSYIVYFKILGLNLRSYFLYIKKNIMWLFILAICMIPNVCIEKSHIMSGRYMELIFNMLICFLSVFIGQLILFCLTEEPKKAIRFILKSKL